MSERTPSPANRFCAFYVSLQQVLDAEEVAPGGVMVTPRPLIPKANQLEAKQARLARWEKDPSLIEKDMADRREAVSRAEEKDLRVCVRVPPVLGASQHVAQLYVFCCFKGQF